MKVAGHHEMRWRRVALSVLFACSIVVGAPLAAPAAAVSPGDLVDDLTFNAECPQTAHGAGVAFDGSNLWYTCNPSGGFDLFRADPATGRVTGSWRIVGGLGAIAYDGSRNGLWAGMFGAGTPGDILFIQLDDQRSVDTWSVAFNAGDIYWRIDGMAYDGLDDSLYFSPDGSTIVSHFSTDGTFLGDAQWAGSECQNSGLAVGGDVLLQATNGCYRVYAADKSSISQPLWSLSVPTTAVHNEGLACDTETFASLGHQVVWIRADNQARVFAFKLPDGTCGTGGLRAPSVSPAPTLIDYPLTAGWEPSGMTTGPDGNVWFTEGWGHIGRITLDGEMTVWTVPTPGCNLQDITSGSDGALWFTEYGTGRIGRITTYGEITEFVIPGGAVPSGITRGPDGNVWFAALDGKIGRVTPTGEITVFAVPDPSSRPIGITSGPDGALWFTEYAAGRIGRITTSGVITEFDVPQPNDGPMSIELGADGNLWFGQEGGSIGRITPDGDVTEFPVPTPNSTPWIVTPGPDGNIWFAEHTANRLGRISPSGTITEFPLPPTHAQPWHIVTGPDGRLWFGDFRVPAIGRFTPPDHSAPNIEPHLSGALGREGWYVSDVVVTWAVSDPESAVTLSEGCNETTVNMDTSLDGLVLSCTASSAGGTASRSIVVKRDAATPELGVVGHADGAVLDICAGPPLRPTTSPSDPPPGSGLDGTEGDEWTAEARPSGVGSYRYRAWATDRAGNPSIEVRTISVRYGGAFGAFLQPKSDGSSRYKVGSTVKVEFALRCGATTIKDALAMLMVQPGNTLGQDVPSVDPTASTSRNTFAYNSKRGSYVFSLPTGTSYLNPGAGSPTVFAPGTWTLRVLLDDGTSRGVLLRLTR